MMLATVTAAGAATRVWEEVDRLPVAAETELTDSGATDEVSTFVADGYIYVAVRQRISVKVFTILGQLVVQDTLSTGIYRFKLPSRGIYLLKAGSVTRRVTA